MKVSRVKCWQIWSYFILSIFYLQVAFWSLGIALTVGGFHKSRRARWSNSYVKKHELSSNLAIFKAYLAQQRPMPSWWQELSGSCWLRKWISELWNYWWIGLLVLDCLSLNLKSDVYIPAFPRSLNWIEWLIWQVQFESDDFIRAYSNLASTKTINNKQKIYFNFASASWFLFR